MKGYCQIRILIRCLLLALTVVCPIGTTWAAEPAAWRDPQHTIIVDAYEMNTIDWDALLTDKRIAAFISKASDGLPESFSCADDHRGDSIAHCRTMWRKYAVSRELFRTRRLVAKAAGLLWGAYHMGRPGNPIDQANHFLDYADPKPDELMVLDIDGLDPRQFMSLDDAQVFIGHIKARTGRYPILYTNHTVAKYIADHRSDYPILSRLPLWYARYRPDVGTAFPMGNWDNYAMWQFSSGDNCSARSCPYRVPGTLTDIDVNVAPINKVELAKNWPQGGLLPPKPEEAPEPTPMMVAKAETCNPTEPLTPLSLEPILTAAVMHRTAEINELNYQDY
jgi:GH25 family lysozyme M1 (1,4-beta-N-acetylmuramidase)